MVVENKGAMKVLLNIAKMKTDDFLQERGDDAPLKRFVDYAFGRYNLFWDGKGMMRAVGGKALVRSAGHIDKEPNNVYRALKKSILKHTKFGIMTGGTISAIDTWNERNTRYAGIKDKDMWLRMKEGKFAEYPFSKFFDEHLKRLWGDIDKARTRMLSVGSQHGRGSGLAMDAKGRFQRAKKISRMESVDDGNIIMKVSPAGFSIKWPASAKALGLRDFNTPNTTFANKKYGARDRDLRTGFYITKDFENYMLRMVRNSVAGQFVKVEGA